jgi:hypothetical protein
MSLTLAVGYSIYYTDGFPNRFDPKYSQASKSNDYFAKCNVNGGDDPLKLTPCKIGDAKQTPTFLVFGDSHALAVSKAISDSAERMNIAGELTYNPGCPTLLQVTPVAGMDTIQCHDYIRIVTKYIKEHPELSTVILAVRWTVWVESSYYKQEIEKHTRILELEDILDRKGNFDNKALFITGLNRMIKYLQSQNRKIVIIAPIPEIGYPVPSSYSIASRTGRDINKIIAPTLDEYLSRNQRTLDILSSFQQKYEIQMIEPWKILCKSNRCLAVYNGTALYIDNNHLSAAGADLISPAFDPLFESLSK